MIVIGGKAITVQDDGLGLVASDPDPLNRNQHFLKTNPANVTYYYISNKPLQANSKQNVFDVKDEKSAVGTPVILYTKKVPATKNQVWNLPNDYIQTRVYLIIFLFLFIPFFWLYI